MRKPGFDALRINELWLIHEELTKIFDEKNNLGKARVGDAADEAKSGQDHRGELERKTLLQMAILPSVANIQRFWPNTATASSIGNMVEKTTSMARCRAQGWTRPA
jgi:hypothetical protein